MVEGSKSILDPGKRDFHKIIVSWLIIQVKMIITIKFWCKIRKEKQQNATWDQKLNVESKGSSGFLLDCFWERCERMNINQDQSYQKPNALAARNCIRNQNCSVLFTPNALNTYKSINSLITTNLIWYTDYRSPSIITISTSLPVSSIMLQHSPWQITYHLKLPHKYTTSQTLHTLLFKVID